MGEFVTCKLQPLGFEYEFLLWLIFNIRAEEHGEKNLIRKNKIYSLRGKCEELPTTPTSYVVDT